MSTLRSLNRRGWHYGITVTKSGWFEYRVWPPAWLEFSDDDPYMPHTTWFLRNAKKRVEEYIRIIEEKRPWTRSTWHNNKE
jgi:hypothetical protein